MALNRRKQHNPHYLPALPLYLLFAVILGACTLSHGPWPGREADLSTAAEGYLAAFLIEPIQNGQVFCATETLDVEQTGEAIKAFLWALCIEYYPYRGVLQVGAGFSGPLMVYMFENEPGYLATGFALPRDGALFPGDVERIFPPAAVERMCLEDSACCSARVYRLEGVLEGRAHEEFDLPVATKSPSS